MLFDRNTIRGLILAVVTVALIIAGYAVMQRVVFHRWELWYQLQQGGETTQATIINHSPGDLPSVTYQFDANDTTYFYTENVDEDLWEKLPIDTETTIRYAFDDNGRLYAQLKDNRNYVGFFTLITVLYWLGMAWLAFRALALIVSIPEKSSPES